MGNIPERQPDEIFNSRDAMSDALNEALEVFTLHEGRTFDEVMTRALRPIANAMGIECISVERQIEIDGNDCLKRMFRWDAVKGAMTIRSFSLLNMQVPIWINTLLQDRCVNQRITAASEVETVFMNNFGIKSILIVPIFRYGGFWGCVAFWDFVNAKLFDETIIDMIRAAAFFCANAVIGNEAEREAEGKTESLTKIMLEATPLCCHLWDRDFNIIDCNETAVELFGLVDKQDFMDRFHEFSPEFQPDGLRSGEKIRMCAEKAFIQGRSAFNWLHEMADGTPMLTETTLVRVNFKDDYVIAGFTKDLRNIKKMEGNILQLESEMERIYRDKLTGVYNVRFCNENLNRMIKTLSRSEGKLSVIMVDVDLFKDFNDKYGHSDGDKCLKTIAETLMFIASREDDFVVRGDSDEFLVVLPNTNESGARLLAGAMVQAVKNCNIPHEKDDGDRVTISVGVTTGKADRSQTADDYIKRAGRLLQLSKQGGRDRFTFENL